MLFCVLVAAQGCERSPPDAVTVPENQPTVAEQASEPEGPSAEELLAEQREKLREAQQLREQVQRELDAMRAELEQSNLELQRKQSVADTLQTSTEQ